MYPTLTLKVIYVNVQKLYGQKVILEEISKKYHIIYSILHSCGQYFANCSHICKTCNKLLICSFYVPSNVSSPKKYILSPFLRNLWNLFTHFQVRLAATINVVVVTLKSSLQNVILMLSIIPSTSLQLLLLHRIINLSDKL